MEGAVVVHGAEATSLVIRTVTASAPDTGSVGSRHQFTRLSPGRVGVRGRMATDETASKVRMPVIM